MIQPLVLWCCTECTPVLSLTDSPCALSETSSSPVAPLMGCGLRCDGASGACAHSTQEIYAIYAPNMCNERCMNLFSDSHWQCRLLNGLAHTAQTHRGVGKITQTLIKGVKPGSQSDATHECS